MIVKKYTSMKAAKTFYDKINRGRYHGYQSYEVLSACDSFFYKIRRKGSISNYVVIDTDGEVLLIAPLRRIGKDTAVVAGDQEWFDYVDIIYSDRNEEELAEALDTLLRYLKQKGVKNIPWRYLDNNSITKRLLDNGYQVEWKDSVDNVGIFIEADDYEDFFKSLKKHPRQNVRTAYNRLNKEEHSYRFEVFTANNSYLRDCKDINGKLGQNVLGECLNVYIERQSEQYEKGGVYHSLMFKHFHYITKAVRDASGFMAVFFIDEKVAGFMHGFITENAIEIPRLAINMNYSFYSPGMLLVNETIKYMMEHSNIRYLDLCRGTEKYKFDMGGTVHQTLKFNIRL